MIDLALTFDVMPRAYDGDLRALADWIEEGAPLDEEARIFVAAYLRGEIKNPRGQKRTFVARMEDSQVFMLVKHLAMMERAFAAALAKQGVKYRAKGGVAAYLELRPNLSEDTLKSILARARRDRLRLRELQMQNRVKK